MTTNDFDSDRPPLPPREPGKRKKRGGPGRGGPDSMVPDAEFTSYYGHSVVKPMPWGKEIAAYLALGGLAGGSGLIGAGAHATGRRDMRRKARWSALVALGFGGAALVADLGKPLRAANMMRTMKLTSPMSVGSWILAGFGASGGLAVATDLLEDLDWVPDDSFLDHALRFASVVGSAGSAFFAPPLAAYTAVLLSNTASPTWHASYRQLPFVFVNSGNAAASGLALILNPTRNTKPVRLLAVVSSTVDLVMVDVMEKELGMLAEPMKSGRAGGFLKAARWANLGGAIGAAVLGGNRLGAALSGVALVAGSVFTRFGIFEAGIESAKDPKYTMQPQRERFDEKVRRGEGITQPGARESSPDDTP